MFAAPFHSKLSSPLLSFPSLSSPFLSEEAFLRLLVRRAPSCSTVRVQYLPVWLRVELARSLVPHAYVCFLLALALRASPYLPLLRLPVFTNTIAGLIIGVFRWPLKLYSSSLSLAYPISL